jgi:tRNA pseudouridine synthase 10
MDAPSATEADAFLAAAEAAFAEAASPRSCRELVSLLLSHHVCPRCVLRFCSVTTPALYAAPVPAVADLLSLLDTAPPAEAAEAVCPACWGALQHVDVDEPLPAVLSSAGSAPGDGPARGELRRASNAAIRAALATCGGHAQGSAFSLHAAALPPGLAVPAAAQAACLGLQSVVGLRQALPWALSLPPAAASAEEARLPSVQLTLLLSHDSATEAALRLAGVASHPPPPVGKKRKWAQQRAPPDAGCEAAFRSHTASATLAQEAFSGAVKRVSQLGPAELAALFPSPLAQPSAWLGGAFLPLRVSFLLSRPPVCFGGYYTKLIRGISQTPWLSEEQEVGNGSVSGDIEALLSPVLRADSLKFIAAGREDMDVRMLAGGRPFLIEAVNARCSEEEASDTALRALCERLVPVGRVGVRALTLLSPHQRGLLREGEAEKSKAYRALVHLSRPVSPSALAALSTLGEVVLAQMTPLRVLHRRAPLTRARSVLSLNATAVAGSERLVQLDLRCAAGLYVKEFVHSDWGRTRPALAELIERLEAPEGEGREALRTDCLELDVMAVEMEWV